MKVLLELRPALDGHAGIPQETRLLFRALARMPGVELTGLVQSSSRVLAGGLPDGADSWPEHRRMDRLSRVVVSLHQGGGDSWFDTGSRWLRLAVSPVTTIARTLLGRRLPLTHFPAGAFRDFVWRALFARTLPIEDFDSVTSTALRIVRPPWTALHRAALAMRRLGHALYPRLDTAGFDLLLAETPFPGRVRGPTKLVVRYHDAIPVLMPHTISNRSFHQASHFNALRRNVRDGAWFACVSDATRRDLLSIFPEAEPRALTIPNMISHAYYPEETTHERLREIVDLRAHPKLRGGSAGGTFVADFTGVGGDFEYLLMVSTIEPRKNHLTLLSAWEELRTGRFPNLRLVLVGSLGWDHKAIVAKLQPWLARGGLHVLEDVPAGELRLLYRHARATVCPSFGEGFDFSGVEAMCCGGVVAASDIAVHREVFGEAANYFSPYSAREMAEAVTGIIAPEAGPRRDALAVAGAEVSQQYLPDRVLPRWREFLDAVARS